MAASDIKESSEPVAGGAFVLVVDDDPDNARIASGVLRERGFEVEIASNGESALAAVERRPPDVIVLDVMMPVMDGMQVLAQLKANPQHTQIPVIVVTGKGQDEDLLDGYRFGADYYIIKPFTGRQLLYAIGLVLGRAQT